METRTPLGLFRVITNELEYTNTGSSELIAAAVVYAPAALGVFMSKHQ